jgi:hypothetical protein
MDERVESVKNKTYKEAYSMALIICFFSIIVKFYLYGVNTDLVFTEFLIIIVTTFYYSIRTVWLGIYSDEVEIHDRTSKLSMDVKSILFGLGSGVAIAVFFGIRSAVLYGNEGNMLKYFILVFFASLMIYCPIFVLTLFLHKAANKISKDIVQKNQDEI